MQVFVPVSGLTNRRVNVEEPEPHVRHDLSAEEFRLRMLLVDQVGDAHYVFDPESTDIAFVGPEIADTLRRVQDGTERRPEIHRSLYDLLRLAPAADLAEETAGWGLKLHLNHNCNLACEYCYADGRTSDSAGTAKGAYGGPVSAMSAETLRSAVEPFLRDAPGDTVTIVFFGGEPLLSARRFLDAVAVTNELGARSGKRVTYAMTTNATLLTPAILACLRENRFRVTVSVDGTRETHDRQRPTAQGKPSYDAVLGGLRQLSDHGVPAYVRMTAFRDRPGVEADHLATAGLPAVDATFQFSFYGDDATRPMAPAERAALLGHYLGVARAILAGDPQARKLATVSDFVSGIVLKRRRQHQCGAGRSLWAVGADGDVYPCHRFVGMSPYRIGNVRDAGFTFRPLGQFTGNRVANRVLRSGSAAGNCALCYAHHLCGGGCAQVGAAATGRIGELPAFFCQDTRLRARAAVRALAEVQGGWPA